MNPTWMSHGRNMQGTSASAATEQTWSTHFALDQHTGSPYLRGTRCGVHHSAAELRNVPHAHLATDKAQAVPIHRPGTQGRSIIGNNVKIGKLLPISTSYCLFLPIRNLPKRSLRCLVSPASAATARMSAISRYVIITTHISTDDTK